MLRDMHSELDDFSRLFNTRQSLSSRSCVMDDPFKMDVTTEEDKLVVKADAPGVSKDNVSITVSDNNILTIKMARFSQTDNDKNWNYCRQEISYGALSRSLPLPTDVNADDIHASLENGELIITIPKVKPVEKTVKRISIR